MRVVVGETPGAERYICLLDGVDISMKCVGADSDEGWADCYVEANLRTYNGGQVGTHRRIHPDLGIERLRGRVELYLK